MELGAGGAVPDGITVEEDGGGVLVHLRGDVDVDLRAAASRAMVAVLACDGSVTVDASQVRFIDSSGLAFLLQLHGIAADAGRPLTLRDPSGAVRGLLARVGLEGMFTTEDAGGT